MLVSVLVLLALGVHKSFCTLERQRERLYIASQNQKLTSTQNPQQKSTEVDDKMSCVYACTSEPWCKSVNFKTTPESNSFHICELLSFNQYINGSLITQDKNYTHYVVEGACKKCKGQCRILNDGEEQCIRPYSTSKIPFSVSGSGRIGSIQSLLINVTGLYLIRAGGARGGTHSYNYGYLPGTYFGGKGATMEGKFHLEAGKSLNVVVGQRGGNSVEVKGGQSTTSTAAQLGKSIEDNAGTGGGGGSFVYTEDTKLLVAAGGGGGASSGYHGADGQAGANAAASIGTKPSQARGGGTNGNPGICNSAGGNYHGGVGAGWLAQGCARAGVQHGERGGSRIQGWAGGQAGKMNCGLNGGPAPGAVGGFGGGGGGSEDNGASGGGGGYSGGGSGIENQQAGGGGGSYCSGSSCQAVSGGNSNDNGFVEIHFLS